MARGRKAQPDDIVRTNYTLEFEGVRYVFKNSKMVMGELIDDPKDPLVKLEKLSIKLDKLKEPSYHENGRKKRVTKADKEATAKTEKKYWDLHYTIFPNEKPKRYKIG
jgi:hypothetical protein